MRESGSGNIALSFETASGSLEEASHRASQYAQASRADNTKRAYKASWKDFERWCELKGLSALPAAPETVVMFVAERASELKIGTLGHRLAAITVAHKMSGFTNPASRREEPLQSVWRGITREVGSAKRQVEPLTKTELKQIVRRLDVEEDTEANELRRLRDRALLLVGFAGALRRSELAAVQVSDLAFDVRGVKVSIRRSKTDQEGEGEIVGIPATGTMLCPVTALVEWLEAVQIEEGLVFRSIKHGPLVLESITTRTIANIVKKHVEAIGLDPSRFSGHSLRAGLITQAAQAGVPEVDIMRQSRHKSVPILRQYVRKATVWEGNAAAKALQ